MKSNSLKDTINNIENKKISIRELNEEYIKKMGHNEKSFEAEGTEELLINFHVQKILSEVKGPTDAELQKYYQENKESFNSKESITASHILLKTDPGSDEKVKSEKLKAIQKKPPQRTGIQPGNWGVLVLPELPVSLLKTGLIPQKLL